MATNVDTPERDLVLTPPDPVPTVTAERAAGLVPIDEAKKSQLDARVDAFVADLVALHDTLLPRYDDPAAAIVTAGGSAFPDVVADVLAEAAAPPRPLRDPLRRVAHPRRGLLPVGVALRRRGPPARGPRDRTSGLDA